MSHQARIDFEGQAIQCCSICKTAEHTLSDIDTILKKIEDNSSLLLNEDSKNLREQLLKEKDNLNKEINSLKQLAEEQKQKGVVYGEVDTSREIVNKANLLLSRCNSFSSQRIYEYEALLNRILATSVSDRNKLLQTQISGTVAFSKELYEQFNKIEDVVLKDYVYLELIKENNIGKSFDEIVKQAQIILDSEVNKTISDNKENIIEKITKQLKDINLEQNEIDKIVKVEKFDSSSLQKIQEQTNKEIVDEHVRKEALKCIIKSIEQRGFIVDKKNIKLQRDKNQVVLIAQKVNGQTAEFQVFLDGRFIYKFDGYEGQACQKDINPFLEDLEKIYGIKVTKSETLWSNPDKISTMKYQTYNTNKDKK